MRRTLRIGRRRKRIVRFSEKNLKPYVKAQADYEKQISKLRKTADELDKISKGYGNQLRTKITELSAALTNKNSMMHVERRNIYTKREAEKAAVSVKQVTRNLQQVAKKPDYDPAQVKNTITTFATKAVGLPYKIAKRTGQFKPDFSKATKEDKKDYQRARRVIKENASIIFQAFYAFKKAYGFGDEFDSNQIMSNIVEYVKDHNNSSVDEIIKGVYEKMNRG